ncbi:MAG: hypothetical protein Q4Q22_06195 [Methanosphaera sp.]|nr:hypothetical protein [Methanosphaera sp.]
MDIKKFLVLSLLAVCLLGCITTVSAGLFDFLDDGMEEHDFGNFTMNVPKNTTFKEMVQPNGNASVDKMSELYSENGYFSIEYNDSKWKDPEYKEFLHPLWENDDDSLSVSYIDCNEDKLTKDNAVEESYIGYELVESKDEGTLYHSDGDYYIIRKDNEDKSVVLISSKDEDLLWKMADSIKFK